MAASADDLRQEMARIRAGARGKAFLLKHETKQLLDWKYYFRLAPWGILGSALLAGYLLVPTRRSAPREVDPDVPAGGRRRNDRVPSRESEETADTVKKAGLMTAGLGFLGTVIYRAGINYATKRLVERLLAPRITAAETEDQESTHEFSRSSYR